MRSGKIIEYITFDDQNGFDSQGVLVIEIIDEQQVKNFIQIQFSLPVNYRVTVDSFYDPKNSARIDDKIKTRVQYHFIKWKHVSDLIHLYLSPENTINFSLLSPEFERNEGNNEPQRFELKKINLAPFEDLELIQKMTDKLIRLISTMRVDSIEKSRNSRIILS